MGLDQRKKKAAGPDRVLRDGAMRSKHLVSPEDCKTNVLASPPIVFKNVLLIIPLFVLYAFGISAWTSSSTFQLVCEIVASNFG